MLFLVKLLVFLMDLLKFKTFMRKNYIFVLFVVSFLQTAFSQNKTITVEEIYQGAFRTEGMDVLRSLKNGKQYTVLNFDRNTRTTTIDKYDYSTLQKVETIVSSSYLKDVNYFSSYEFNKDESKIILATDLESIYRHSTLGIYFIYDIASKQVIKIAEDKIQEPSLSPDGKQVAYVKDNNIFLFHIASKETKQITTDGKKNGVINGVTDWVYEEEFAFVRAFEWNSNGTKIAFLRFDEANVPEFSMDVYGKALYQTQEVFKYPKAGEENAKVSLHMFDVKSGKIAAVNLNNPYYIPRIKWMQNANYLSVQTLNRHQNNLQLLAVNAKNNKVSVLLEEKDAAYVDITDDLTFLVDDSFIWTSEKDGWNHIYLYNYSGELVNQITKGDWEVTSYYGYDQNEDKVYYQSTENGSINRGVYSIESNGKNKKELSIKEGHNSADFSADFTYYINTYSSATTPSKYTLHTPLSGKKVKDIKDNSALLATLKEYKNIQVNNLPK